MKEFSKEIIEIDGAEYTLFLNRLGVVAFERYTESIKKKVQDIVEDAKEMSKEGIGEEPVIEKGVNPFDDAFLKKSEELLERTEKASTEILERLYWILLYNEHKMDFDDAKELYSKACEEYGREQVDALGKQMIEEVNSNKFDNEHKELKNLKALHQPKK